ncbi:hypothetical protein [Capnocytophaga gingivalis]|uniref:fibronectin type III domain-containing protein n=1 Tax=Capnocytophaga gingivalis TaxID=1017 RepID=UPI0028D6861F|nr:hypothetical protein [Capnocytophaga gingivalis]
MKQVLFVIVYSITFLSFSQENPSLQMSKEVRKSSIALRWAVDTPVAWQKANNIGFQLERTTYLRNGKVLTTPETKVLGTFKTPPLEKWQEWVEKNNSAAIVAQAIYGETFETEISNKQNPIEGIANKAREIDDRFSFALMAADLDFSVACFAGWGYVDNEVLPNESYLYKIKLLPNDKLTIKEGGVVAGLKDFQELPAPFDFRAHFEDRKVTLMWDYQTLNQFYNYYFIEKAEGEAPFVPITEHPVVNMNQNSRSTAMIYVDSLAQNDKEYRYRLRGKTIFDTYSPYSQEIRGKGIQAITQIAQLTEVVPISEKQYRLHWDFSKENENEITHFSLLHSPNDKVYKEIKTPIAVGERQVVVTPTMPSNYYKVRTYGKNGTTFDSFAMLVQPNDETPPERVQQLTGTIDTLGVVSLQWKANTDADLMGYYVFRGNQKGEEMMRITGSHITNTSLKDTVALKSLNTKVYYWVTAIDFRKNESAPSVLLELTKPDKVPPTTPIFIEYTDDKKGWKVTWRKSFSDDVSQYLLYQREKGTTNWKLIHSENHSKKETYTYIIPPNVSGIYEYAVRAKDHSNNFSDYSPVIQIIHQPKSDDRVLRGLQSRIKKGKITLQWLPIKEDFNEMMIYKAINGEKPTLWRSFTSPVTSVEDADVQIDNIYQYFFKVILKDNSPTPTEKIEVKIINN